MENRKKLLSQLQLRRLRNDLFSQTSRPVAVARTDFLRRLQSESFPIFAVLLAEVVKRLVFTTSAATVAEVEEGPVSTTSTASLMEGVKRVVFTTSTAAAAEAAKGPVTEL